MLETKRLTLREMTLSTPPLVFGEIQGSAVLVWEKRLLHSISATGILTPS